MPGPAHTAPAAFADVPARDETGRPVRVSMLTRQGCHLCGLAAEVIDQVCAETGTGWAQRDIDQHPELLPVFGDWLPVIFVDGKRHDYWRVDPQRLTQALSGY